MSEVMWSEAPESTIHPFDIDLCEAEKAVKSGMIPAKLVVQWEVDFSDSASKTFSMTVSTIPDTSLLSMEVEDEGCRGEEGRSSIGVYSVPSAGSVRISV
ncbi:hypothetical protein RND81_05G146700 [Saponaria officinalis]|uniref:Uncharacterized protein n=1 Tax=Saponaria officinalis TaxID=3572 RepID=A0AAW1KWS1_SAPOF